MLAISIFKWDTLLQEVFQSIGPVEGCKLIRKEKVIFSLKINELIVSLTPQHTRILHKIDINNKNKNKPCFHSAWP
jgi:hypothetical protein